MLATFTLLLLFNIYYFTRAQEEKIRTIKIKQSLLSNAPNKGIFRSQCGQDFIVSKLFGNKTNGYYVDLAANDAIGISNTYILDRVYGWNGLCMEANPNYWYGLVMHRTCHIYGGAIIDKGIDKVNFNFNGVLGGITDPTMDNRNKQGMDIPGQTFESVLKDAKAPKTIEYLSLDVEGAEWFVMHQFPFESYKFFVMTVERPGQKLSDLFKTNGYVYIGLTANFGDQLWFHKDFLKTGFGGKIPSMDDLINGYTGPKCETHINKEDVLTLLEKKEIQNYMNSLNVNNKQKCQNNNNAIMIENWEI